MSQFQNPEVFPNHTTMFTHVNIGAYDMENFFYFLAQWPPVLISDEPLTLA